MTLPYTPAELDWSVDWQTATAGICPPSFSAWQDTCTRWARIAKPLGGMGLLETALCQIGGAQGALPRLTPRAAVVFCADNGVVAQGVTQAGQEVTSIVARNMTCSRASISLLCERTGTALLPVDIGLAAPLADPAGMLVCPPRRGTRDISNGPALTSAETAQALNLGVAIARTLGQAGCMLLIGGEMGIGNTTTSSALLCALLGLKPEQVAGRGAGLSDAGLRRKRAVITQALEANRPDPTDAFGALQKVGGLDLAGLAGLALGCAYARIPMLLDGLISCTAAVVAARLCPAVTGFLLASHTSAEPGARAALQALGLSAPIDAGLHLGEGSGAALLLPLLDLSLDVMERMPTFAQIQISPYQPQEPPAEGPR